MLSWFSPFPGVFTDITISEYTEKETIYRIYPQSNRKKLLGIRNLQSKFLTAMQAPMHCGAGGIPP